MSRASYRSQLLQAGSVRERAETAGWLPTPGEPLQAAARRGSLWGSPSFRGAGDSYALSLSPFRIRGRGVARTLTSAEGDSAASFQSVFEGVETEWTWGAED